MAKKKTNDKSEPPKPKGAPKVVDVAEPGKTAASATSRPIIVGHGPMIQQDPMVVEDDSKDETKLASAGSVKITPSDDEDKAPDKEEPQEPPKEEKSEDPASEKPVEETSTDTDPVKEDTAPPSEDEKPQPEKASDDADKPSESSSSAETGSVAANELANKLAAKKEEKAKVDARTKKVEELNKLVASRKYFVHTYQGPGGTSFSTWLLIILLLAVVGVYLAIDADLLNVGIALPFDLIK